MFLKKVLNQPNLVGTVMIALLLGAGFVYAFAFDGFNIETVPSAEVDARIEPAVGPNYGKDCDNDGCTIIKNMYLPVYLPVIQCNYTQSYLMGVATAGLYTISYW